MNKLRIFNKDSVMDFEFDKLQFYRYEVDRTGEIIFVVKEMYKDRVIFYNPYDLKLQLIKEI